MLDQPNDLTIQFAKEKETRTGTPEEIRARKFILICTQLIQGLSYASLFEENKYLFRAYTGQFVNPSIESRRKADIELIRYWKAKTLILTSDKYIAQALDIEVKEIQNFLNNSNSLFDQGFQDGLTEAQETENVRAFAQQQRENIFPIDNFETLDGHNQDGINLTSLMNELQSFRSFSFEKSATEILGYILSLGPNQKFKLRDWLCPIKMQNFKDIGEQTLAKAILHLATWEEIALILAKKLWEIEEITNGTFIYLTIENDKIVAKTHIVNNSTVIMPTAEMTKQLQDLALIEQMKTDDGIDLGLLLQAIEKVPEIVGTMVNYTDEQKYIQRVKNFINGLDLSAKRQLIEGFTPRTIGIADLGKIQGTLDALPHQLENLIAQKLWEIKQDKQITSENLLYIVLAFDLENNQLTLETKANNFQIDKN